MNLKSIEHGPLQLSMHIEEWTTKIPFRITGHCWRAFRTLLVELTDGTHSGRGESLGVYYFDETPEGMQQQIETVAEQITQGISREALLDILPAGGARNAVDCALWDLEAKQSQCSIWELTGINPQPVTTTLTIGIEDTPHAMAQAAAEAAIYPILKVKLDAHQPVERVAAIREARPDATIVVDPNQAWTFEQLKDVAPKLAELDVKLIEQPLPRGGDEALENYTSPVPLSGDESCQHRGEFEQAARRYQIINIKLDKTGGLTEALLLAQAAQKRGLDLLVSNMGGTSLSSAQAYVVAQLCKYVELDGQFLLKHDRLSGLNFSQGMLAVPGSSLWG